MSHSTAKTYDGRCYCNAVRWQIGPVTLDDVRTSLCHCQNCKRWTGSAFGVTTKVPWTAFRLLPGSETPVRHGSDNGSGSHLTREFCGTCGGGVREWGQGAEGKYTYVCYGSLEDEGRKELAPKAEFFCGLREVWQRDIDGDGVFRKEKIKD